MIEQKNQHIEAEPVIFIINRTLRIGGVERKIADIAAFLKEREEILRWKVFLLLNDARPQDPNESTFFDAVADSKIQVLTLQRHLFLNRALPFLAFVLLRTLELRPNAILAFLRWPALTAVITKIMFWRRAIRVVISEDCLASQALESQIRNRPLRILLRCVIGTLYPLADVIVSPTSAAKTDMCKTFGIPPEKVVVNRNWVPETSVHIRRRVEYDAIYVGRVDTSKNISMLVNTIRDVAKRVPNIRVCIVGGGDDLHHSVALAERYNLSANISFVGFQKNATHYLARSRIFCMPSRHEGVPMAALEAMGNGLPIVAMGYAGVEELVVPGETGFICRSECDFRIAIELLVTNHTLAGMMGEHARKRAETHHSMKNLQELLSLVHNGARRTGTL